MNEAAAGSDATNPKKQARPLGSLIKSELFDQFYLRFVDDAVAQDIRSVIAEETERYRSITLAGFHQMRVDKKTHQLSFHVLRPGGKDWQQRRSVHAHFRLLQTSASWRAMLTHAWAQRMASTLPATLPEGQRWYDPQDQTHPMVRSYGDQYRSMPTSEENRRFLVMACSNAGERRVPKRLRTVLSAILARAVWRHLLDPEVLKLTVAIYGPRAQSSDYNRVAKHRKALRARVEETPSLAPVLGPYLQAMHRDQAPTLTKLPDLLLHARRYLLIGSRAHPGEECAGNIALAAPVWRYLARSSRTFVQMVIDEGLIMRDTTVSPTPEPWLRHHDESRTRALQILKSLAATQQPAPFLCVKWLLRRKPANVPEDPQTLDRAIRLVAGQAVLERRQGTLKAFIAKDVPLVWDYLHREDLVGNQVVSMLHPIAKNATWDSLMRRQRDWHATLHLERARLAELLRHRDAAQREKWRLENAQARAIQWDAILEPFEVDGFTVTPLTSGNALEAEGIAMSHCVDQDRFMRACQSGVSRVFHIQGVEQRSTLQLSRRYAQSVRWDIEQHFGWDNELPSAQQARVARRVLARFQAVFDTAAHAGPTARSTYKGS